MTFDLVLLFKLLMTIHNQCGSCIILGQYPEFYIRRVENIKVVLDVCILVVVCITQIN